MLIIAEFFLQLINSSYMLILNIYMSKLGYKDYAIAEYVSFRFLGVLLLAFPLGLFIKGRKLRPLFYISGIALPFFSLLVLEAVQYKNEYFLLASLALWGVSFTLMQVCILPFIMRNASKENQSEAIALNYSTWSISTIISGSMIYGLYTWAPGVFDEKLLLQIFACAGFISLYFVYKSDGGEVVPTMDSKRRDMRNFDWLLIAKALVPTIIIAVGAGLTIPFINLFFFKIHGMDSNTFSMLGAVAAVLVFVAAISIPGIRRKYGYSVAITLFQSLAVLALVLLATTEYISHMAIALPLAVLCYLFRQPLMNMAGPMTSELVMNYVGKRNQEMMSALTSAVWSGSWYISARIFMNLREENISYADIFYITAALYALGVVWYQFLIRDYHKRVASGLIAA